MDDKYQVSQLKPEELQLIKDLESRLGGRYILIAYNDGEKDNVI